jgi:hypothetical protein
MLKVCFEFTFRGAGHVQTDTAFALSQTLADNPAA